MTTVHKFAAPVAETLEIKMPKGAEVLTVQVQHGDPCVWARVDTDAPVQVRKFRWFGTGHLIIERAAHKLHYVGTIQQIGGSLVFHLFEDKALTK